MIRSGLTLKPKNLGLAYMRERFHTMAGKRTGFAGGESTRGAISSRVVFAAATALCLSPSLALNFHKGNITAVGQKRFASSASHIALDSPVQLYQYDSCPYCNKAQAFMEYHGIPYEKIEVNPLSKEQIAFSSYKMVPLAMINEKQINGSGAIIDFLSGNREKAPDEEVWFSWVDDHLVHLLPPNIYRTPKESLQAFEYITRTSGDFSTFQKFAIRYVGAAVMHLVAKKAKKKYNLSDNPRQDLVEALSHWTNNGLGDKKRFHGGDEVDSADLAVFGVLRSIDGNYTTWEDIRSTDFENSDKFWTWFDDIKSQVGKNANIQT